MALTDPSTRIALAAFLHDIGEKSVAEGELAWRYPLKPLSPESLFPQRAEACTPRNNADAKAEYHVLWDALLEGLKLIPKSHVANLPLWLDHFDSLRVTVTAPHFPRRVLLAVTGLTPQIVTETLYALAVAQTTPWIPTEIRLITTAVGAQRARLSLLDPKEGQFHALCRDYGLTGNIAFPSENIMVIRDASGAPLTDIRTPEDNTLAADALLAEVRALCADETCALHVSIAGGRKTMGFFLGYALSLFGRSQDRLSHVLVNEPFESLREFYYPPAEPRVLHTGAGRPIHTADAQVLLAEIPFVRLRDGLPREALAHGAPFASIVSAAQLAVDPPALRFDLKNKQVWCSHQAVALPPTLLAWYAWLAECRVSRLGEDGFVRSDESPERYLSIYETVVGRNHPSLEKARLATRDGLDRAHFEEKRSKINRKLAAVLSLAAAPYKICSRGQRPFTRYGIALPPSRIVIECGTR